MKYQFSLGGGMGDVFNHMVMDDAYAQLDNLKPEDTCDIFLNCHNPFIKEMFEWHPKKAQLNVIWHGYWMSGEEMDKRRQHGIFTQDNTPPGPKGEVKFYPSDKDRRILDALKDKKVIVIQATAGCADRDIPLDQMDIMLNDLRGTGFTAVGIGRNYQRSDRYGEFTYEKYPWVVSMVDQLSIPGTVELVRQSAGVIACHSCICLMARHFRKPNILTLPRAINHINGIGRGENNQWTFGLFQPETRLVYSEDYSMVKMAELLNLAKGEK